MQLLSEIKIHRGLSHPHIVKFEHVFEDNENVYILLEMCTNQTLNDLCKRRKRLTEWRLSRRLSIPAPVKQLSRAVDTDDAIVVSQSHDEHLSGFLIRLITVRAVGRLRQANAALTGA